MLECRLVTDAGEHVEEGTIGYVGKAHAVGGDDRKMKCRREVAQQVVVGFFVAQQVALQFDADIRCAEGANQTIDEAANAVPRAIDHGTAGQRDETADRTVECVERQRALTFRRCQLHPRQQPAEILIALSRSHEDRQAKDRRIGERLETRSRRPNIRGTNAERDGQFGADDRFDARTSGRLVKPGNPIDAVAIEQRQCRIAKRRRSLDESFGKRRAVEKRKRRRCVQFDVHGANASSLNGLNP